MERINISNENIQFWKRFFKIAIPAVGITFIALAVAGLLLGLKLY
jgi:hypothetical protein